MTEFFNLVFFFGFFVINLGYWISSRCFQVVQPIAQSVLVLDFTCLRRHLGSYLADLLNQFPVGVVLCFCPLSLSVCCSDCYQGRVLVGELHHCVAYLWSPWLDLYLYKTLGVLVSL